jgi:hypothetical protein
MVEELNEQDINKKQVASKTLVYRLAYSSVLKKEMTCSSGTLVDFQ